MLYSVDEWMDCISIFNMHGKEIRGTQNCNRKKRFLCVGFSIFFLYILFIDYLLLVFVFTRTALFLLLDPACVVKLVC